MVKNLASIRMGAIRFANEGAKVVVADWNGEDAEQVAAVHGEKGIKVNAICRGTIRMPMTKEMLKTRPTDKIPVRRFEEVQEVAELVVFLVSDQAKFMNGAAISIDGGYTVL